MKNNYAITPAMTPMCTYTVGQSGLKTMKILKLFVQSCSVGPELHPSFDAGSPPCSSPQSHEILLNKGMKYWESGLNAGGSRTFTAATVHIEQQ